MYDERLDKLKSEIGRLSAEGNDVGLEFLLEQLEEDMARVLRLCAIPHQFNADLMSALTPELDAPRREQLCEDLSNLPLVVCAEVVVGEEWLSLEDEARAYLFGKWLEPELRSEFAEVSGRLVEYYGAADRRGSSEWLLAERMFHLIGVTQDEGLSEFERLFQTRRDEFRLGECDYLIGSVHEYDPVLTPLNRTRLAYQEGKLHADRNQWEDAKKLFHQVLDGAGANPRFRAYALDRLGEVYAVTREWNSAIDCYLRAMAELDSQGLLREDYRVTYNLGVAYRDSRYDLDEAEKLLRLSIERAEVARDKSWVAKAYNSLGTLYLTLNDSELAIRAYEKSIQRLEEIGERDNVAQVNNNIGLIYIEQEDWGSACVRFLRSLETARRAGDTLTQAHAQANLGTAYVNLHKPELAEKNLMEAYFKFEEMRRPYFQAVTARRLARLYHHTARADLASQSFSTAIALFEKSNGEAEVEATVAEANLFSAS